MAKHVVSVVIAVPEERATRIVEICADCGAHHFAVVPINALTMFCTQCGRPMDLRSN